MVTKDKPLWREFELACEFGRLIADVHVVVANAPSPALPACDQVMPSRGSGNGPVLLMEPNNQARLITALGTRRAEFIRSLRRVY